MYYKLMFPAMLIVCLLNVACSSTSMGKKDQRWDDLYGFSNHGNDANYTLPKGYVGCLDDAPNMTGC